MCDKLKIGDVKIREIIRYGTREILVILVVIPAEPRCSPIHSVRGCIERDVNGGLWDEKEHPVSVLNRVLPPTNVFAEAFVEVYGLGMLGSKTFGGETSVEEESPSKENIRGI